VGPVEDLTRAARRMARGERPQRVPVRSRDEIGELARAFNHMAGSVAVSEQLRRQMVTDIAHELRTPLTNIRGYLEAVRDGVVTPRPEVMASLHEEALLLTRLVDDLQALALAEAGQLELRRRPVDLAALAEKTVTALRPVLEGGPAVRIEMPAVLPPVRADPERVSQVLRNLLDNARRHTPPEGEIVLSARSGPGALEVSVRDTGSGIAPEHLPFIFERFYRADQARARATGGAGLGLAIVRQLVEAHGGQVSARSRPGAGAAFTFTLPIVYPE
jgi:signal transduction histidine kinase